MWTVFSLQGPNHRMNRARRRGFRPQVEALEDRYCLSPGAMEWSDPLDPTFGTGGTVLNNTGSSTRALTDVKVLSDGRLLAAGYVGSGSRSNFAAARYNPDGTPDPSFGSGGVMTIDFKGGDDHAAAVAVQPGTGGKVLVAGTAADNGWCFGVVRLNPDGTLDTTFGAKGRGGK